MQALRITKGKERTLYSWTLGCMAIRTQTELMIRRVQYI